MRFPARVLCACLSVWLTAAAAFPPCCWSMSDARDHQSSHDRSAGHFRQTEHHHHQHDTVGATAILVIGSTMSAFPAPDCDTESADAVVTRVPISPNGAQTVGVTVVDTVVPPVSARFVEGDGVTPPGASPDAAFLHPLRI